MQNHSRHAWVTILALSFTASGCRSKSGESGRQDPANEAARSITAPAKARQPGEIPELSVPRIDSSNKITVDGILNEPEWTASADSGAFVNVGTGSYDPTQVVGGRARLLWSQDALFLAIDVRDPDIRGKFEPGAVDPHLWTENTAEIMIDPDGDGDNRDYYEIQIGPQNLVFDSRFDDYNQPRVLPDGPFGHQEWTAHVTSAVAVHGTLNNSSDRDQGYVVEAKIPWSVFDKAKTIPPRPGDQWRMNFYAMRNNGGVAWSPILGQGNFHKASRFGRITWAGSSASATRPSVSGSAPP
jgi:hypothetical protein